MNTSPIALVVVGLLGLAGVVTAWLVFRTDSMVRAAYWLMASFVAVGAMIAVLDARFLGLVLILMMAGEMTIMAIFMVMFMMNPAGLNPMIMVHQHRTAIAAGIGSFLLLASVPIFAELPDVPAMVEDPTSELGFELLGRSMLIFESVGVALLAVMIGSVAIASRWGRYGDAYEGSEEPPLDPVPEEAM